MRLILLTLLLASCASPLTFHKKTNGDGYTVKELSNNRHFEVLVFLPSDVNDETKLSYGQLAAMEECLTRGYEFVDYSEHAFDRLEVRCFPKNEIKMLGITYFQDGLKQTPKKFIVEKINKPSTLIRSDDVVIAIAGEEIFSMPQVKSLVLSKGQTESALSVKLIRDNRVITIKEPLTIVKDALPGKEELVTLRSKFR